MKAAVVPKIGGKWEVKEVPTPHPANNQVLIKMHASGLCYTDVHITEGHVPTGGFPRTIGHEPAGEIVEVGEGVTSRKIGDRVGCTMVSSVMRKVRMVSAREADVLCTNDWHKYWHPRKSCRVYGRIC